MELNSNVYEINWNNFKAKYNGREEKAFELLSYVLFCKEHGQKYGIFRYKNQTGIETNTILFKDEEIGFQAKFYETSISKNKNDIIDSILKTKKKNSNISKIYLYLNKELSESPKENTSKPKYQQEIEQVANNNNMQVIWRVPSHFEKQLIELENKWLYECFFSLNKGIIDFLDEISLHTNNHLESIKTDIKFNNSTIKIDRTDIIEQLKKELTSKIPTIIVGKGGCGKTALIKDFLTNLACPLFLLKAYEFNNKTNINNLFLSFGQYSFSDFLTAYAEEPLKVFVIDSAEKLADIENIDVFKYFVNNLVKYNWKIIFTTREAYLNDLIYQITELCCNVPSTLTVPTLSQDELKKISNDFNFELPADEKLCELLTLPFYLSEFLQVINNKSLSDKDFRDLLWQKQIMNSKYKKNNLHTRREEVFLELIKQKSITNSFYIKVINPDNEALSALCNDEIIKYDENQYSYFITHDIYEEWGLEKFIGICYKDNISKVECFLNAIGSSLPIRRSFRNWLSVKLYDNVSSIQSLIISILNDNNIEKFWKDEILVSIMLSPYANMFFEKHKSLLLEKQQELLLRVVFMLRMACKSIDYNSLKMLAINENEWLNLKYILTIPKGKGWEFAIKFICENIESIDNSHKNIIVAFLQDWVLKNKKGVATKYSGEIALHYFNNSKLYNNDLNAVIKILLQSSNEIDTEIESILNKIIEGTEEHKYTKLAQIILEDSFEVADVIIKFPDKIFDLIKKEWFLTSENSEDNFGFPVRKEMEENFGLKRYGYNHFPASAFQTPILILLNYHFMKTINFIISLINVSAEKYANSELVKEYDNFEKIKVYLNSNRIKEQYSSERLWDMYRGHSVTPYALQSVLMALERVLLEIAENGKNNVNLEQILIKLISDSNSVAISAVVASIVTAYPDKLYNVAKILFSTPEFLNLDLQRKTKDQMGYNLAGMGSSPLYANERIKSNKLPHREKSLEDIALYYQLADMENCSTSIDIRRKELSGIWDFLYSNLLPKGDKQTKKDINTRFSLARIDYRKLEIDSIAQDNQSRQVFISFKSKEDPELDKHRSEQEKVYKEKMRYIPLRNWAEKKFCNEVINNTLYDNNPHLAFEEMQEILKNDKSDEEFYLFYHAVPPYVAAVLLESFNNVLTKKEAETCKNVLINYARIPLNLNYNFQYSDGTQPALEMLGHVINSDSNTTKTAEVLLVFALFNYKEIRKSAITCLLKLWDTNFNIANNIWLAYLKYKPEYDIFSQKLIKLNYNNKFKEIDKEYKKLYGKIENFLYKTNIYKNIDISLLDYNALIVGFQILPDGSCYDEHQEFSKATVVKFINIFDKNYNYDERKYREAVSQFSNKFSSYLLKLPQEEIDKFLEPILSLEYLDNDFAELLLDLSVMQDGKKEYKNFWYIWLHFYEKIKNIINASASAPKEIIENYLLSGYIMNCNNAKSWHSLKQENISFYYNIAEDIGKYSETLYSIARVFNGIAFSYIEDGIKIIRKLINSNTYDDIDANTIYYIENIVRNSYIVNRKIIKTNIEVKNMFVEILTFLVNHGSVFGYMLREQIL